MDERLRKKRPIDAGRDGNREWSNRYGDGNGGGEEGGMSSTGEKGPGWDRLGGGSGEEDGSSACDRTGEVSILPSPDDLNSAAMS